MAKFTIGRSDGRSNQQVIIDLIKLSDKPGAIFTYEEIGKALTAGGTRSFDKQDVQAVVRQSLRRLEKECLRTLQNIKGVGYRIAAAGEHMSLARIYENKGDKQVRHALSVLQHVKLDEMDENTRRAHEGSWMLMSAVYSQQRALVRRQNKVEDLVQSLKSQVDSLKQ